MAKSWKSFLPNNNSKGISVEKPSLDFSTIIQSNQALQKLVTERDELQSKMNQLANQLPQKEKLDQKYKGEIATIIKKRLDDKLKFKKKRGLENKILEKKSKKSEKDIFEKCNNRKSKETVINIFKPREKIGTNKSKEKIKEIIKDLFTISKIKSSKRKEKDFKNDFVKKEKEGKHSFKEIVKSVEKIKEVVPQFKEINRPIKKIEQKVRSKKEEFNKKIISGKGNIKKELGEKIKNVQNSLIIKKNKESTPKKEVIPDYETIQKKKIELLEKKKIEYQEILKKESERLKRLTERKEQQKQEEKRQARKEFLKTQKNDKFNY